MKKHAAAKPLVYVKWFDCGFYSDTWMPVETAESDSEAKVKAPIHTVGLLWKETKDYLLIVPHWDTDADKVHGAMHINKKQIAWREVIATLKLEVGRSEETE